MMNERIRRLMNRLFLNETAKHVYGIVGRSRGSIN